MCALLVATDVDEVVLNHLQDADPLLDRAIEDKLLEEVVPILVLHDLGHLLTHFVQEELNHGWC